MIISKKIDNKYIFENRIIYKYIRCHGIYICGIFNFMRKIENFKINLLVQMGCTKAYEKKRMKKMKKDEKKIKKGLQLKFETSIVHPCRSEQSKDTKNTHAVFERLFSKKLFKKF